MSTIDQPKKNLFYDFSFWTLLFSNLITIFFATRDGWSLSTIMLIYWFQSVIIGLFNWNNEKKNYQVDLQRLGLTYHYEAIDFWNDKLIGRVGKKYEDTIDPERCKIICLKKIKD